jgi:hypothetical protein
MSQILSVMMTKSQGLGREHHICCCESLGEEEKTNMQITKPILHVERKGSPW